MKIPRNGSLAANASLLALGAMLGGVGTWLVSLQRDHMPETAVVVAKPATKAPRGPLKSAPGHSETRAENFRHAGETAAANPEAGFAKAGEISSQQDRTEFLSGFYGAWSQEDPAAAAAHAKANLPPGAALSESLSITGKNWGQVDPQGAWKWAEEALSGPLKQETQTSILQGWTEHDPEAASKWLLASGLTTQPFFDSVAGTWASSDPKKAIDFAQSIPDDQTRKTTTVAVVSEVAKDDPKSVIPLVEPILNDPKNSDGPSLVPPWMDSWGTADPVAAAKYINGMPNGPSKREAINILATVWAASDINAAVAWSQRVDDPAMRQQIIQHLGTTWGAIEPDKALAWLQTLPYSDAKNGIDGAVNSWAATDPVGLRSWIDEAGPNQITDTARLNLGDALTDTNITDSMSLALGIADPKARDSATIRFLHQWRKTDPDSAGDWVNTQWSALPTSTQTRITAELQRPVQGR